MTDYRKRDRTMERQGNEVHVETDEVRAGSTGNGVRYVLAVSLLLALVVMSLVWIVPSLTQGSTIDESDRLPVQADVAQGDSNVQN